MDRLDTRPSNTARSTTKTCPLHSGKSHRRNKFSIHQDRLRLLKKHLLPGRALPTRRRVKPHPRTWPCCDGSGSYAMLSSALARETLFINANMCPSPSRSFSACSSSVIQGIIYIGQQGQRKDSHGAEYTCYYCCTTVWPLNENWWQTTVDQTSSLSTVHATESVNRDELLITYVPRRKEDPVLLGEGCREVKAAHLNTSSYSDVQQYLKCVHHPTRRQDYIQVAPVV